MTRRRLVLVTGFLLAVVVWLATPQPRSDIPGGPAAIAALAETATSTSTATATPTLPETPKSASAPRASIPPTVDGFTLEWDALEPQVLDRDHASFIEGWERDPSPADISGLLWSAWTPGTLYFAANIADDTLIGQNSSAPWDDDVIEISVVTDRTHQFSICVDGRVLDAGNPVLAPLTVMTRTVPGGWQLEVAVPAAALGLPSLSPDTHYPFTFGFWDDDLGNPGGFGQTHIIWQGTGTYSYEPTWGWLHLLATTHDFSHSTPTPTRTLTPTATPSPTLTPTRTPTATQTPVLAPATLLGVVYHDLNLNGIRDGGEPGLSGAVLALLQSGHEKYTATSEADGSYAFEGIVPGQYVLIEKVAPVGYLCYYTPAVVVVAPGQVIPDLHLPHYIDPAATPTATATPGNGSLAGIVWLDADGDGIRDGGEPGLVGIQISILRAGVLLGAVTTAPDGSYGFPELRPGIYTVRETHPLWLHFSSTPDEVNVEIATATVSIVNFGNWDGLRVWAPLILNR